MEEAISDDAAPSVYAQGTAQAMLLPGEKLVQVAAISPGIYWHGIAVAVIGLFALIYGIWLSLYILMIAAVLLCLSYTTKKYLVLMTTDHRVLARFGILTQQIIQLRYPQIESVDAVTSLPGQILGYGSVVITGAGRLRLLIPYVRDPAAFRDHLTQKLLEPEVPLPATAVPVQPQSVAV